MKKDHIYEKVTEKQLRG